MSGPYAYPPIPYAIPLPVKPAVVTWFKVYAVGMAVIYVLVLAAGMAFVMMPDQFVDAEMDATEATFLGWSFVVIGTLMAGVFFAGAALPRRPWVWIYDLVLIAIGMTSCALWPATIPLLIFWIKPETKAWFGRTT